LFKKFIIVASLSFVVTVLLLIYQLDSTIHTKLNINEDRYLTVPLGSSMNSFSQLLVNKHWIKSRFWLRNYVRIFPEQARIKAGTYLVKKDTSLLQLLAQLTTGKEYQFSLTFIEGSRFKDALTVLRNNANIKQTLDGVSVSAIAKKLGIEATNPEGWLFPDTYAFTKNTQDIVILRRAFNRMSKQLNNEWEQRAPNLPFDSPYEALIMASIIEKETGFVAEQPLISSVFINRLRKGMRLQTDPTIIYGLGDRYQGDITRAHKYEATPYNTYRINGLPPTPIAISGLSALQATLNPAKSGYFYFVSNGDGRHVFSKTLSEHNRAVRAYLKIQRAKVN
jgi:UPF0755 protein